MSENSATQQSPVDDTAAMAMAAAARRGDRAAFAALHERFASMVHGIALARVPRSEAADIVQEVFLHAMRNVSSLRDDAAVGPWLASIARNLIALHYRQRHAMDRSVHLQRADRDDRSPHDDDAERILQVIRSLPDTYAQTLVLRLVEGLTGPQIATCTGMTPASVRVNLHRGMAMLRERLGLERER